MGVAVGSGGRRHAPGIGSVFGFTGQQFDAETGLTFLRARDLDPRLGGFLSMDSVQPNAPGSQGYNPYAYAANNPTTWVDPSGHIVIVAAGLVLFSGPILGLGLMIIPVAAILICALTPLCRDAWYAAEQIVRKYGSEAREGAKRLPIDEAREAAKRYPPVHRRIKKCLGDPAECARDLAEEVRDRTYPARAPLTIALEQARPHDIHDRPRTQRQPPAA